MILLGKCTSGPVISLTGSWWEGNSTNKGKWNIYSIIWIINSGRASICKIPFKGEITKTTYDMRSGNKILLQDLSFPNILLHPREFSRTAQITKSTLIIWLFSCYRTIPLNPYFVLPLLVHYQPVDHQNFMLTNQYSGSQILHLETERFRFSFLFGI